VEFFSILFQLLKGLRSGAEHTCPSWSAKCSQNFRTFLEFFLIDLERLLNVMSNTCIIWNVDVLWGIKFGFLFNFVEILFQIL
jgi:hypothetical protein